MGATGTAVEQLQTQGYCVLEGLLPRDAALSLADALVALHTEQLADETHGAGEEYQVK